MKSINTQYTTFENLKKFINDEKIQNSSSLLIQIFSGIVDKSFISKFLSELTLLLPEAKIIGSTTDGEIIDGKVTSLKVILSFTQFETTILKVSAIEHKDDGYSSGQYLAKKLIEKNTKLLISFVNGLHTNGDNYLKAIDEVNSKIIVSGGYAGDNFKFKKSYIFTKDTILEKGAVAVSLSGISLQVNTNYSFHWHAIGNELTITKAEGNCIYTIDGQKAIDVYKYYLGEEIAHKLPSIGIEFPIILTRNGMHIARAILSKGEDGSLVYAGNVYAGEKIRIGFGSRREIINASQKTLQNIASESTEVIFIYSCTARLQFMGNAIESETLPLQALAPVSGFFTHGEFFTSDRKELLNQTMTLVSLSETSFSRENPITKTKTKTKFDLESTSLEALIHLINISSAEIKEKTSTLEKSYKLNQALKERIEMALEGSKTSVLDWNLLNDDFYYSSSWKDMLGYRDDELANHRETWFNNVYPSDKNSVIYALVKAQKMKNKYFENIHRLQHRDGHWIWIFGRAQLLYNDEGKLIRMIGTHTDITEEKELQFKNTQQAEIIEQIHDSVIRTDINGYIESWNNGSEILLGYTSDEMLGKHITAIYLEEDYDFLKNNMELLMKTGKHQAEIRLLKKSKEILFVHLSLSVLRDDKNNPIGMIGFAQDITKRKKAEDDLYYQAHHDVLTGLPNRVLFLKNLKKGIEESKYNSKSLALFFIDLDRFKQINDSLGHDIGDKVLELISQRLQSRIEIDGMLARLSGDEFTIILKNLNQQNDALKLAQQILDILQEPLIIDHHRLYVSGSIGISIYPYHASNADELLKFSDTAMYKAKEEGRNNYCLYTSEMTEKALARITMQSDMKEAIKNEDFVIYYQPQFDVSIDKLVGIEALLRWEHPQKGLLLPQAFIELAEETGMIIEMDRWVMKTAMQQIAHWYELGLNPGVLALNLSIKQLESSDFLQVLEATMAKYSFKAKWLELEITEGQMLKKIEEVIEKLDKVNQMGISISIDDFGTGYSSLSLLKRLPIHRLKIDRSFVQNIPENEEDIAIIKAIIALAKSMKLNLIAEGVETLEQSDFLVQSGCDNIQGYYYNPPLSIKDVEVLLTQRRER
jgi:diguanylate cyclase (GGDEF)-like protein/PAS domain S-box-containing protein